MNLNNYVYTFGDYLKSIYGKRVRKLTLHGSFSCPNRDGTLGTGGCTYCNVASFAEEQAAQQSVADQLLHRRSELRQKSSHYLAYFQAYTSTYGEISQLRQLYESALAEQDIVGLCVGTRPDCVPDEVLAILAEYQRQGQEIWLELGLQSAHDLTLKRINRGHDFAAYRDAVVRARRMGIKVCTHLIIGLPKETRNHHLSTLDKVLDTGVDGIKLHPLHIVEGSLLAKVWRRNKIQPPDLESYSQTAAEIIRRTPASTVFHRVSASARPPTLLAPQWCENRWNGMQRITEILAERGGQGSALNCPTSPPVLFKDSISYRFPNSAVCLPTDQVSQTGAHRTPSDFAR